MATAFQPNAFQNPTIYDHLGFQVDADASPVRALSVDQSTQLTADQWTLELNNTDAWRARSDAQHVDISTGLINHLDQPELVKHIKDGVVDEWELVFGPAQTVARMRGRDAAAALLDQTIFVTYVTGGVPVPVTNDDVLPPSLKKIPGVTERIFLSGLWRASTVAQDLATRVGLTCSWQAPDYVLREDVEVSGPVVGTIYQLVEPFSHFEPFKVDVWVEGKTLMVRQRQGLVEAPGPLGPTPGVLNTITSHDLRGQQLLVRATYLDKTRVIRMTGAATGDCSALNATEPFSEQYTITEGGRELRITISGTKRVIDGAEMNSQTETYDLTNSKFVSRKTTTNQQEAYEFDTNCRITNSPKDRGSQTLVESLDEEDGVIRQSGRITVAKVYDTLGFLVSETTTEEAIVDGAFQVSTKEVKRLFESGLKVYTQETTRYTADEEGTLAFDSAQSGTGGGHRPGGPGRAPRDTAGLAIPKAFIAEVIDNEPGAKDFSMQNASMTQDNLNQIRDQARASSGASEYNVEFTAVNIPWLKKGQMLEITGLMYEDGVTPVSLPVMLVYEAHVEYVEDPGNPHSTINVKGIFWSKTYGTGD
jgi:hypothetical protein